MTLQSIFFNVVTILHCKQHSSVFLTLQNNEKFSIKINSVTNSSSKHICELLDYSVTSKFFIIFDNQISGLVTFI